MSLGNNDTLDAEAAARAVLSGRASASAKAGDGPAAPAKPIPRSTASPSAGCAATLAPRDDLTREIYQIITFPPEAEPSAA